MLHCPDSRSSPLSKFLYVVETPLKPFLQSFVDTGRMDEGHQREMILMSANYPGIGRNPSEDVPTIYLLSQRFHIVYGKICRP